jgi:hypothetical protein
VKQTSTLRRMLMLVGGIVIVGTTFLVTTEILDYWGKSQVSSTTQPPPQMQEPTYNAATLPRVAPSQTLDFTNGQNASALLSGWSSPEPSGVWTATNTAFLGFVVNGIPDPKEVVLHAAAWLIPGKLEDQRVQVWSAGKKLAEFELKYQSQNDEPNDLRVPLNDITTSKGSPVVLGLYFLDAKPANQVVANGDSRTLGLRLISLQLTP